ncbi:MAG: hypothetical protein FWF49_05980 [Oscillospiraceae bacterium]|nr:hypothetical protein [Oscillospiraceae bacterium]
MKRKKRIVWVILACVGAVIAFVSVNNASLIHYYVSKWTASPQQMIRLYAQIPLPKDAVVNVIHYEHDTELAEAFTAQVTISQSEANILFSSYQKEKDFGFTLPGLVSEYGISSERFDYTTFYFGSVRNRLLFSTEGTQKSIYFIVLKPVNSQVIFYVFADKLGWTVTV